MAQRFTAAINAEFDLKGHDFSRAANRPLLKSEKWRTRHPALWPSLNHSNGGNTVVRLKFRPLSETMPTHENPLDALTAGGVP